MNKIILVERYQANSSFWSNFERCTRFSQPSIREMLNKYQGYEGELKDIYYVKNHDPDLKSVYDLFLEAPKIKDYKILYISSTSETTSSELPFPAIKVGYDVGICMEECIFSSIMNEVLFGRIPELVAFKDVLNENFLFPDKEIAQKYVQIHKKMEEKGKDVENHMSMRVHEIWKLG